MPRVSRYAPSAHLAVFPPSAASIARSRPRGARGNTRRDRGREEEGRTRFEFGVDRWFFLEGRRRAIGT